MTTLSLRSGEMVEMVKCRSVDICCVQETRFTGKSFNVINGKGAQYQLFWTEK